MTPTATSTPGPNDCCQCSFSGLPACGAPAAGACPVGCTPVFAAACTAVGTCAPVTPAATATPPPPRTATASATPTVTPTAMSTVSATPTPDPFNDTCTNAVVVAATPFSDTVSVQEATTGDTDPIPACGNRSRAQSVWYRVTPPVGGVVTAETMGSTYDTILSTYTGPCDALVAVPDGCNDDQPGTSYSRVVVPVVGGTTYRFMVSSYGSAAAPTLVFSAAFELGEDTPTPTATVSATATVASTATVVLTATPSPTALPSVTPSASATVVAPLTATPTPSRTATPSPSVTRTATLQPTGTPTVPVTPATETPTSAPAIPLLFVNGSNQYACAFELAQTIGIAGGTESFARLAERNAESLRGLYQAIYIAPGLGADDYARLRAMVAPGGTIERFVALGGVAVLNVAGTLGDQPAVAPDGVGFLGLSQHEAEQLLTPLHPYVTGAGYGGEALDSASFEGWLPTDYGVLSDLPGDATTVVANSTGPSWVEYVHGAGRVIATSIGFCWQGRPPSQQAAARNLLRYAPFYQGSAQTPAPTVTPTGTPTATRTLRPTRTPTPAPFRSATPTRTSTPGIPPGDLDGDGRATAADVILLVNALFVAQPPPVADVNGDGRVSVADIPALIAAIR